MQRTSIRDHITYVFRLCIIFNQDLTYRRNDNYLKSWYSSTSDSHPLRLWVMVTTKILSRNVMRVFICEDDGPTLGCFYSAMGINRELCNDPNLAFKYHKKALDVWNQCKQNGFIVITLRRLITYIIIIQNEVWVSRSPSHRWRWGSLSPSYRSTCRQTNSRDWVLKFYSRIVRRRFNVRGR